MATHVEVEVVREAIIEPMTNAVLLQGRAEKTKYVLIKVR